MPVRGMQRDTVPSCKCCHYVLLTEYETCVQHWRSSTVAVLGVTSYCHPQRYASVVPPGYAGVPCGLFSTGLLLWDIYGRQEYDLGASSGPPGERLPRVRQHFRNYRETPGIAARLLRCGIASEALRRNMPLRPLTPGDLKASSYFRVLEGIRAVAVYRMLLVERSPTSLGHANSPDQPPSNQARKLHQVCDINILWCSELRIRV